MTLAATLLRSGLKAMGTNQYWNWRLTALRTRWHWLGHPMTNFEMTIRADCTVYAWNPLPSPIKALTLWLSLDGDEEGVSLWTETPSHAPPHSTPIADIQNKANFLFHQPFFFIDFWAASSRTPLSGTVLQHEWSSKTNKRNLPVTKVEYCMIPFKWDHKLPLSVWATITKLRRFSGL